MPRMTAGIADSHIMVRQAVGGYTTLTSSAPRMPRQMTSWLTLPRAPRTSVGAICSPASCQANTYRPSLVCSCTEAVIGLPSQYIACAGVISVGAAQVGH